MSHPDARVRLQALVTSLSRRIVPVDADALVTLAGEVGPGDALRVRIREAWYRHADPAERAAALRRLRASARSLPTVGWQVFRVEALALQEAGRVDAAIRAATKAVELAAEHGLQGAESTCLEALAELTALVDPMAGIRLYRGLADFALRTGDSRTLSSARMSEGLLQLHRGPRA